MLNQQEATQLIDSLNLLAKEQFSDNNGQGSQLQVSDLMNEEIGTQPVTLESFPIWATKKNSLKNLLNLLHQVKFCFVFMISLLKRLFAQLCHVILGLRPGSRIEEGELISNWLRREVKRGYRVGDFWYLISSSWWKQWCDYVSNSV